MELLVVVVIITTLAAVLAPAARSSGRGLLLEEAARSLAARLSAARDLARHLDRPVRLRILPDRRQYRIETAKENPIADYEPAPGLLGSPASLPAGCRWEAVELAGTC